MTEDGAVVTQGTPLVSGTVDVPAFDQDALIAAEVPAPLPKGKRLASPVAPDPFVVSGSVLRRVA